MGEEFLKIHSIGDAKFIIDSLFKECYSCGFELVSLDEALGRALFEDVEANFDFPPFNRSLKDGYCLKVGDTYGASEESPKFLKLIGRVEAGGFFDGEISSGECVYISTGALIPSGGEAVLMVEYSEENDGVVSVFTSLTPNEEIGLKGSDIEKGSIILERGSILNPSKIGVLAGQGISKVKVYKSPRVSIISTGNELKEASEILAGGEIYDINGPMLSSSLKELGIESSNLGIVRDDYESIKLKICEGLESSDIVILSGGTSAGIGDTLAEIIKELGEIKIHGISVQPGKPTLIGVIDEKLVVGLPGNPVSALIVFNVFILPYIKKLIGQDEREDENTFKGVLTKRIHSQIGRIQYQLVTIENNEVKPIFKDSGAIYSLVVADGYIKIDKNTELILEGETVEVNLFKKG